MKTKEEYIKASDVKSIATIPSQRPTFLHTDGGPVRILGFLVCCGERFECNLDEFATFPIDEDGIVHTEHDGNNGTAGIFHGPIKKGGYDYRRAFQAMYTENSKELEEDFLEYCEEIGLEVVC